MGKQRRFGQLPRAERAGTYYLDKIGRAKCGATHKGISTQHAIENLTRIYSPAHAESRGVPFGTPMEVPPAVHEVKASRTEPPSPVPVAAAEPAAASSSEPATEAGALSEDLPPSIAAPAAPSPALELFADPEPTAAPEPAPEQATPPTQANAGHHETPAPTPAPSAEPEIQAFGEPAPLGPVPTVSAETAGLVAMATGFLLTSMVARRTGNDRKGLSGEETALWTGAWKQVLDKRAAKYIGEGDDLMALAGVGAMIWMSRMGDGDLLEAVQGDAKPTAPEPKPEPKPDPKPPKVEQSSAPEASNGQAKPGGFRSRVRAA